MQQKSSIQDKTNPDHFRIQASAAINFFAEQITSMQRMETEKTIPNPDKGAIRKKYLDLLKTGFPVDQNEILKDLFNNSIHLHDPRYMGHQVPPPYFGNMVADWSTSVLNNGTAVSEMGQFGVAVEQAVIDFLLEKFGMGKGGGVLTSGGSLGNLTAMLAMRENRAGGSWNEGGSDYAVLVSAESHYSVDRAAKIMGWGVEGLISVPCRPDHTIDPGQLSAALEKGSKKNKRIIGLIANSCSTSTGTFDDLRVLGKFAHDHKLWFHVDAAHGGPMIFSDKHRNRLDGMELADSVVFDFHKLLHTPSLVTAVLFRDKADSFSSFDQDVKYLWREDGHKEDLDFEIGKRTLECTRDTMGLKAINSLLIGGTAFVEQHIDHLMDLTELFARIVSESEDFELALNPQTNIVCYRYLGSKKEDHARAKRIQYQIRNKLVEEGRYYIVKTEIHGETWLRSCLMNPLTREENIQGLLAEIRRIGSVLLHGSV